VKFIQKLNPERDTEMLSYYFVGHINHYTNLKFIGVYKKLDSLLILIHKNHKNTSREFLNIYDTINLNTIGHSDPDTIHLRLAEGKYTIIRAGNGSFYYVATLLSKGIKPSYIPFYISRIILLLFTITFLIVTVNFSVKKLFIHGINRIEYAIRKLQNEDEVNCTKKTGVDEFDRVCEELSELSAHIKKRYHRFYEESIKDPLTGAFNLRKFYDDIEHVRKECMVHKTGFVLLIIDVDNFKHVNDTLGHLEGDKVLKELVYIIKRNIRDTDGVYRYGGDEFTVILKNTDEEGAYRIAERIRKEVEKNTNTTVSIGGSYFFVAYTATELMREADKKLYIAKKLGKNRTVILWEDTESTFHEFGENNDHD